MCRHRRRRTASATTFALMPSTAPVTVYCYTRCKAAPSGGAPGGGGAPTGMPFEQGLSSAQRKVACNGMRSGWIGFELELPVLIQPVTLVIPFDSTAPAQLPV